MYPPANPFGDPSAYRAIFFEEAHDHLQDVEALLLRLQPDHADQSGHGEDLNAIFRAVHSIKGSAAMLGCEDMAALTHLQESLLDLLRKHERPLEHADVEAMLKAGDILRTQALCHRGVLPQPPDASAVEHLLREQLARPRSDANALTPGPVRRRFAVQMAPLTDPIPASELDTMLAGLCDMGTVSRTVVDNVPGGCVSFEVEVEGTAADLRSVLSLLVAPEQISIEKLGSGEAPLSEIVEVLDIAPVPAAMASDSGDELFVDPEEFRRKRQAAQQRAAQAEAESTAPEPQEPLFLHTQDVGHIRVSTEKIDQLINLVGELVITEAMLARCGAIDAAAARTQLLESGLADLARHTRNLQEAVLSIRMLPISHAFSRFPRLVHELSSRLGKRVELKFAGETTELDRGLIEKITDPLTHLVRNAIDHGLETPQAREAAGKSATGTLRLQAAQRGGSILIEVIDDGNGLDRERILEQAAKRGIAIAPDAPDEEVWDLVFEPGFSTAQEVTDVSGRGVGMDVVRRNIQALGGSIELSSRTGAGTRIAVSVPLTLAIIEAMTVAVGDATYVLPLAGVVESLSVQPGQIRALPGDAETLRLRDAYLPVVRLAKEFPPLQSAQQSGGIAVIVEAEGRQAALIVDELVGQQQVVVKSLEANFRKVPGLSGATVMGDGSVALILDVSHFVRMPLVRS